MPHALRVLLALPLLLAPAACGDEPGCDHHEETGEGCGEGGAPGDGQGGAPGEGGASGACVDDEVIFCRCPDGLDGTKTCADGAFGACTEGDGSACD